MLCEGLEQVGSSCSFAQVVACAGAGAQVGDGICLFPARAGSRDLS